MPLAAIVFFVVVITLFSITGAILFHYFGNLGKINLQTQDKITDQNLLRLIADQPDGIINNERLANLTGLTKLQARKRLYNLHSWGVLKVRNNSKHQHHYSLSQPLDQRELPTLSPEPFLTVDDLLLLFKHYDYQIDAQQLVYATGLPLQILKHEMKYFARKNVIDTLTSAAAAHHGWQPTKTFILKDPYRTQPDQFLAKETAYNLELKTLLKKEDML